MEVIAVTYTFLGFLFLCVSCLFCQCCKIRYESSRETPPTIYLYQPVIPDAPPFDYVRFPESEEPTELTQV